LQEITGKSNDKYKYESIKKHAKMRIYTKYIDK